MAVLCNKAELVNLYSYSSVFRFTHFNCEDLLPHPSSVPMELMMHPSSPQGRGNFQTIGFEYDPATAHTVEVHREVNDNGELGSFGFTLLYEKPPIVGTIVPGEF